MSRIRSRDTAPEKLLRQTLWRKGARYRLYYGLPGAPDIAFPRHRLAIFIDGCFWHECPEHGKNPRTNTGYWTQKLASNKLRDANVNERLTMLGWKVMRFWEHEVKRNPERVAQIILDATSPAVDIEHY